MNACERFLKALDIEYAYNLAKKMEQYRSNPVLGYRTAGSEAERLTGDMLYTEMKNIGLCEVCKDPIHVDAWSLKELCLRMKMHWEIAERCSLAHIRRH